MNFKAYKLPSPENYHVVDGGLKCDMCNEVFDSGIFNCIKHTNECKGIVEIPAPKSLKEAWDAAVERGKQQREQYEMEIRNLMARFENSSIKL